MNGIVATDSGYTKIFFVTSSAARAKDRARVEDELSRLYGVQVTIHDRAWIINEVIDKNRLDLAVNYLKIGDETDDLALGPSDYSRKQQLADIERELEDPSAFVGMKMQRASEALLAATLARGLELPRTDVGSRFLRAVRLADDGGGRTDSSSPHVTNLSGLRSGGLMTSRRFSMGMRGSRLGSSMMRMR